jgi:hypothetical protein
MIFALRRDVVDKATGKSAVEGGTLSAGNVMLRPDKRPRPLVLRMNVHDCLHVNFTNLLTPGPISFIEAGDTVVEQPATRTASVHVMGMQLVSSIADDGSWVGNSPSSLVHPGGSTAYTFYAEREGGYLLYSTAAVTGGEGNGGSLAAGLFGAVNVEPTGAEWYRSQVTAADMQLASTGTTADGHPKINYNAAYPAGHPRAGLPILKMLNGSEIVHTDLNAIITGRGAGGFGAWYKDTRTNPNRNQPFREFTAIFHDEIMAQQAFQRQFEDPVLVHTLHGVRDGLAINYGTGGVGAEILANRKGVGPTKDCVECKYEEFFLASWAMGDPAMMVDVPADSCVDEFTDQAIPGCQATKALYPDDPSNVHHSYINDHVKFRNIHAGPKEHHIFHLHAHQWVHTPDNDNSAYLDSQSIGPGASFTYEIAYNGSGNRNKTVGDSIFHCHFYPHFAQGMWELWRSHDVFEAGTVLDADGRPAPGSRALPDGEIVAGTPIPALVPLPTIAMAPLPSPVSIENGQVVFGPVPAGGNPGYPFFMGDGARAGHRPPHPPLDTVDDGGLPRHIIVGGLAESAETRLDFHKNLLAAHAIQVPEDGTPMEKAAMAYHHVRTHPSFTPAGLAANFTTNGSPRGPQHGAPFADPCVDDAGRAVGVDRVYKAAAIQLDIKFNKAGWHFPQSRMLSLWGDVNAYQAGAKPPEPFFFRATTNECITYYHTNLVPNVYQGDDFQVTTPTDILGQHIHLVKFDVTSSDGSGNGWNYEDGTFSYQEVQERINAINDIGGSWTPAPGGPLTVSAKSHPFFGVLGAQTTVQRWYADATLNNLGQDRTLRTVFTHDHFGPSTHQQAGLYASLVIEPLGSTWRDPESGLILGTRQNFDGGPTSWNADILTPNVADSYREFVLQFADFQLAYRAGGGYNGYDPANVINPPARDEFPDVAQAIIAQSSTSCPGGVVRPCPEAISAADVGTMTVNYRNEPIALRVLDPTKTATATDPDGNQQQVGVQAAGFAGDLSFAFSSAVTRADPQLNAQPSFYPPLTGGMQPGDPFTPLLRAYEGDRVQIRVMVGANEEGHNFSINGVKWLYEPSDPNSGWRNSQMIGISEHFEFDARRLDEAGKLPYTDHLYKPGSAVDDLWNGLWGLMRVYDRRTPLGHQPDLLPLPNNRSGHTASNLGKDFKLACPRTAPARNYNVTAVTAQQALPPLPGGTSGTLMYNSRGGLNDPTAILYVRSEDLDATGKLKPGAPVEPLVLRAASGDCINVTLVNKLPATLTDLAGLDTVPVVVERFNVNQLVPSSYVGLHPQLVEYVMAGGDDGMNVGFNPLGTAPPNGGSTTYRWYAGDVSISAGGQRTYTPIEFGATNLSSSDPIKHSNKGAIGALIIEPQGSTWVEDYHGDLTACGVAGQPRCSRASATVTKANGSFFRDFVLLFQDDINLRHADGRAVPLIAHEEDPEDSGHKALNYRTEPSWLRLGYEPDAALNGGHGGGCLGSGDCTPTNLRTDRDRVQSNAAAGGADPETPVFTASRGDKVRFRILHPGGHPRNHVFNLHGHIWQQEPYTLGSTVIGNNPLSEWKGSQHGIGPSSHFDIVPMNGAGGAFGVTGDYLFRDQQSFYFDGGLWGIFRVR